MKQKLILLSAVMIAGITSLATVTQYPSTIGSLQVEVLAVLVLE